MEIISTPEIGSQIILKCWNLGEKGKSGKFSSKGRRGLFGLDLWISWEKLTCKCLYHLNYLTNLRYGEVFDWHPPGFWRWWPQPQATWDLNFYLFALTLAYRRDLIQMSQRAVSLGLVFLRDWKWLLGDEHQSRASRQLNSFLGSCDTLLRSFLSHKW